MIGIGIVGIGFGQQVHAPAWRADRRCRVAAVAASTAERAAAAAERMGVAKAYGGWREMIRDAEVDAVSIATPPAVQAEIALEALRLRKPVFCEKPLAGSLADAAAMSAAAERAGVANMVDFEFPEIDVWRRAKELLEGGGIGALRQVAVAWHVETYANRKKLDSWKTRAADGGGTLSNFVSHTFCYLEWMAGPIQEVSAHLFRAPGDAGTGDTVTALALRFVSGAVGTVSVSAAAFPGSGHRVELYGEHGALRLDNTSSDYISGFRLLQGTRDSGKMEAIAEAEARGGTDGRVLAVGRLTARFADWMETSIPATPAFREGLRVQQLLEAARRSHEAGGRFTEAAGGMP